MGRRVKRVWECETRKSVVKEGRSVGWRESAEEERLLF